jgi:hypothetical protein
MSTVVFILIFSYTNVETKNVCPIATNYKINEPLRKMRTIKKPDHLLTVQQFARLIGISRQAVYNRIKGGSIIPIMVFGRPFIDKNTAYLGRLKPGRPKKYQL